MKQTSMLGKVAIVIFIFLLALLLTGCSDGYSNKQEIINELKSPVIIKNIGGAYNETVLLRDANGQCVIMEHVILQNSKVGDTIK
jgi:hypothetical protein